MTNEEIMNIAGTTLLASSAVSILVSCLNLWIDLLKAIPLGVRLHIIAVLAFIPCIAFVVSCVYMPEKYNIRLDLIIYPQILFVVIISASFAAVVMVRNAKRQEQQ